MATLIKNEAELKAVLGGIQQTITWETMGPFVEQCEIDFIIPAIGESFYDELSALVAPNAIQTKILKRLKIASGYYALASSLSQLVISIGDMGAAVNVSGGTSAMPKWSYVELKKSSIDKADRALENALTWLEANKGSFGTWSGSSAYTISKELFINSATELTQYYPAAQGSRRMYLSIREYIKQVERFDLEPAISTTFFNALKAKVAAGTALSADEKTLFSWIKYFIASKAVAYAIPFLNINSDFRLVSEDSLANAQSENALDRDRRDGLKVNAEDQANYHFNKMKLHLDTKASATVFSEYFSSTNYTASTANQSYYRTKNDPNKSYVVF